MKTFLLIIAVCSLTLLGISAGDDVHKADHVSSTDELSSFGNNGRTPQAVDYGNNGNRTITAVAFGNNGRGIEAPVIVAGNNGQEHFRKIDTKKRLGAVDHGNNGGRFA